MVTAVNSQKAANRCGWNTTPYECYPFKANEKFTFIRKLRENQKKSIYLWSKNKRDFRVFDHK